MVVSVEAGGWGWTHSQANAPYTAAIVIWAVVLLAAGVVQDRIGPKRVIQIGVFLVGAGLIASSLFRTPIALVITSELSLRRASASPTAVSHRRP